MSENESKADTPSDECTCAVPHDWWASFHLQGFLSLTLADRKVERRELVWIKSFFRRHCKSDYCHRVTQIIEQSQYDPDALPPLVAQARARMTTPQKRQFVYNLAQMCKAKGEMNAEEYENILDIAEQIGIADTEADAIINSVYSINDTFIAIVGMLALGVILYFARVVFVPLVVAMFLTMIINRLESTVASGLSLQRLRWLSRAGAMTLVLTALFALTMAGVRSAEDFTDRLPFYEAKVAATIESIQTFSAQRGIKLLEPGDLDRQLRQLPVGSTVSGLVGSLVDFLSNFFMVVVFTGFLVASTTGYEGILQEINDKVTAYISVKALTSVITGVAVFVLCWTFGVDFALFWAILVFLLNFIPSVGSVIASAPPILLAFVQLDALPAAVVFAALFVVTQLLIGNVLEPKIMGHRLAVKPVAILFGLIFWGFLWGIPGMFLAAPLMAVLRILSSYFNFSRDFERLLAAD